MQVNTSPSTKEDGEKKEDEDGSISAPLVLSQERMDEVCRRLHSLQQKIQRLQVNKQGDEWESQEESRLYDGGDKDVRGERIEAKWKGKA